MENIKWLINRLIAMNVPELVWRIQQKMLQKIEYKRYFVIHLPVTKIPIPVSLQNMTSDEDRIAINWNNTKYRLFEKLDIFGVYDYQYYKKKWNAGFQTENTWPTTDYSYNILISQRDDIGDIRTNWELNRHFQFVGLAKNYYVTGNQIYLNELKELFWDWNENNLFLHGVQWISAMEVAIRVVSWTYMYCFLEKGFKKQENHRNQEFLDQVLHGIKVMANYIAMHRARFTSANNHLIIEMLGIGVAGILFNNTVWINQAIKTLTEELPRQNSMDGVNKEMSLHYQCIVMEAYGILWLQLKKNGIAIPDIWNNYLTHMSEFVADCCGDYSETVVFGDNDEGKNLDFGGEIYDYYRYVLQLMGIILNYKYTDTDINENVYWLADDTELHKYICKRIYCSNVVRFYKEGGYVILRSKDHKVLIGFDFANLGFGSIAAHGHADALSIQVFYEGVPILVDSGTYNYHFPKTARENYRRTLAHNTIHIESKEQAEILGPFLWGKRYTIVLEDIEISDKKISIQAAINYNGIHQVRQISFDYYRKITVKDVVMDAARNRAQQIWNFIGLGNIEVFNRTINTGHLLIRADSGWISLREYNYSPAYCHMKVGKQGVINFTNNTLVTEIKII